MMDAFTPDFLNLELWNEEIGRMLSPSPHELKDIFGNQLSAKGADQAGAAETEISVRGKIVAKLRSPHSQQIRPLLEGALESRLCSLQAENEREINQLLVQDLDMLLDLSEIETMPIEETLQHLLRILRAHVWVEQASIHGMLDGFTLEEISTLGPGEDWKALHAAITAVSTSTKKNYLVEKAADDPNLKGRSGVENLRNLLSVPMVHGQTVLGVVNVANRLGSSFSELDLNLIKRFSNLAAHILQKNVFKSRMQNFERANENLGKYVSKKVAEKVEDSQEIFLGGTEKKVVCLFSDIRGYTSITEGTSPATLVKLLNFHFEKMHAIIEKHEGTLDKIVGDLIMAVWNMPKDQPDPELLAMKAALEMQKEMIRVVIPEWQRNGVEKVGMGVGVNSGLALVGNLGSSRFMNYTVIGDAVNVAQRLESKAKAGEIWMNESIYSAVHGKIEKPVRREIDIHLKGKEQTINALVYRPLQC